MTKEASHTDYPAFLAALKERILHARTSAARAINHELVLLYWDRFLATFGEVERMPRAYILDNGREVLRSGESSPRTRPATGLRVRKNSITRRS
jgi:hypothetical protein